MLSAPLLENRVSAARVERVGHRSEVTGLKSHSPLRVLTPSNHGHAAWLYVSSLGGGFVGADSVALDLAVGDGATCFLSSQASSKAYRASNSTFDVTASVEGSGTLVVWPDAVTCFAGASLRQTQRVSLSAKASVMWVDVLTAGRVSQGERWAFNRFANRLSIDVAGQPWLRESTLLSAEHGALSERMTGVEAVATVTVVGPAFGDLVESTQARIAERLARDPVLLTASPRPGGLVMRATAPSIESLTSALRALLQGPMALQLGDDPLARKW